MYRLSSILTIGVVLAVSAGCRQTCGEGHGWFTSNSNGNSANQPCRLVGSGKPLAEGCYDAVTGVPVPCPPQGSTMVMPGGYPVGPTPQQMQPPANELPFPTPTELIPQPGLPYAPPSPAPGLGMIVNPNTGQPVKITPIK
jgi:hypothetical protein